MMVLLVSSLAYGQTPFDVGSIDIFGDINHTTCNVSDAVPPGTPVVIYIFSTNAFDGSTASQFKVTLDPAVNWFLGSTDGPYTMLGTANTDISVAYGSCLTGDTFIMSVSYFVGATAPACSWIQIQPADLRPSGKVEIADCQASHLRQKALNDTGGSAFINDDGTCNCIEPVQEKTWGGIKALYTD
jgi:hypothetical protein